jgi:hypothetical protein
LLSDDLTIRSHRRPPFLSSSIPHPRRFQQLHPAFEHSYHKLAPPKPVTVSKYYGNDQPRICTNMAVKQIIAQRALA